MNPAAAQYRGLTRAGSPPVWSGVVRSARDGVLFEPLRWRRPRRVFVNSMSDLFHESLTDEEIDRVFAVMALTPRHTYQVLTKRAERMRHWFAERWQGTPAQSLKIGRDTVDVPAGGETGRHHQVEIAAAQIVDTLGLDDTTKDSLWTDDGKLKVMQFDWPLPNVWLGVSTERQVEAEQRVPALLETPASRRFISAEPLLGAVRLDGWLRSKAHDTTLDWVIAGGESGPRARPSNPDWFRLLRDHCAAAGVSFFFKQWGEWAPCGRPFKAAEFVGGRAFVAATGGRVAMGIVRPDSRGYREVAPDVVMQRVGKAVAGALLDGREWRQFPA